MANRVEKLKERALEISEVRNELKEQKATNITDLSITDELFNNPLEDESDLSVIKSLSKAVNIEQDSICAKINKNQENIKETSTEADSFIKGLRDNIRRFEQMKIASDLVDPSQQINDTKTRISKLEEVKQILGSESLDGYSESAVPLEKTLDTDGSEPSWKDIYMSMVDTISKSLSKPPTTLSKIVASILQRIYLKDNANAPGTEEPSAKLVQLFLDCGVPAIKKVAETCAFLHPPRYNTSQPIPMPPGTYYLVNDVTGEKIPLIGKTADGPTRKRGGGSTAQ